MDAADIGCSLAEAAETPLYNQYLSQAAQTGTPAMHVVYINTSLKTKAQAHAVVPTITCTSSNVVQTVLQVSCSSTEDAVWKHVFAALDCPFHHNFPLSFTVLQLCTEEALLQCFSDYRAVFEAVLLIAGLCPDSRSDCVVRP